MNQDDFESMLKAVEAYEASLPAIPGVLSIEVGFKNDDPDVPCIVFLVDQKLPKSEVRAEYLIPTLVGGFPTDVREAIRGKSKMLTRGPHVFALSLGVSVSLSVANRRVGQWVLCSGRAGPAFWSA